MKLIVEIETKDDKTQKHTCNDFPSFGGDFITLFKDNFVREYVRTETVQAVKTYFR